MKKLYIKPLLQKEAFEASEYIAACYHGVCNITGYVFSDVNRNGTYEEDTDEYNYYNTKCNHDYWIEGSSATLPEKNAFVFEDYETKYVEKEIPGTGIMIPVAVRVGIGTPISAWNWDTEHTTTSLDLQNRPNHS